LPLDIVIIVSRIDIVIELVTKLFLLKFYLFGYGIVRHRKKLFTIAGLWLQTFLLGLARLARKSKISLRNHFVTSSLARSN